jgi:hypothetical protein
MFPDAGSIKVAIIADRASILLLRSKGYPEEIPTRIPD